MKILNALFIWQALIVCLHLVTYSSSKSLAGVDNYSDTGSEPVQKKPKALSGIPFITKVYDEPDISIVQTYADSLVEDGFKPEEILIVFDIDDTLVDKKSARKQGLYSPRNNAVNVVRELFQKGFKLLSSSANQSPISSFKKLQDINLLREFNVFQAPIEIKFLTYPVKIRHKTQETEFQYYREGNVIAARQLKDAEQNSQTIFERKAIATDIIFNEINDIRAIIFVDDKKSYIRRYVNDVKKYFLFQSKVINLICIDLISLNR